MGIYRPWRGLPDGLTGEARTDGMDAVYCLVRLVLCLDVSASAWSIGQNLRRNCIPAPRRDFLLLLQVLLNGRKL